MVTYSPQEAWKRRHDRIDIFYAKDRQSLYISGESTTLFSFEFFEKLESTKTHCHKAWEKP